MQIEKSQKIILLAILAVIIGCIYVYPDLKFIYGLKDNYHGITLTGTTDELTYLGRINAFYKGNDFTLSGFDNYEEAGKPWTFGFFPEVFLGAIGKLLGISVVNLDILMSFLLPALLFILIYILVSKLSGGSFYISLVTSSFILLGYNVFTIRASILKRIFSLVFPTPLWFLRPISPQFNHIMLILALLFIYKALDSKKAYSFWIAAAVVGLLFYTYSYYWTFIYTGLFVLIALFAIGKNFNLCGKIILMIAVSFTISIPYWINFWHLIHFSSYSDLLFFNDVKSARAPIIPLAHLAFIAFIIFANYKKRNTLEFCFMAAFLIGGLVCINQHLVTGKSFLPGNWINYSNKTFLIIALFSSLDNFRGSYFIKKFDKKLPIPIAVSLFLSALLFLGFKQQDNYYNAWKFAYTRKQSLGGAFSWLKEHAQKDDVVLVNPFNSMRQEFPAFADILVYTDCYSFLPVTDLTLRSKEALEDRYFIGLRLFGYGLKEAEEFIKYYHGAHFVFMGALKEYGGRGIEPEYVDYLKGKFNLFLDEQKLLSKLDKYRMNYILVRNDDRVSEIEARQSNNIGISRVYADAKFSILKFKKIKPQDGLD